MINNRSDKRILARTAGEIKRYRNLTKIFSALAGALVLVVVIVYIVTILYNKYGSFTVRVNKFDNLKYALSLSETPDFSSPTIRLNSRASQDITCIRTSDLPKDLNMINGSHNGDNYVAYTFYCKNSGIRTVDYSYQLYIANMTRDIDKAVRVRLYVNGEYTDYARTRSDGLGPEPNTTEFYSNTIITQSNNEKFEPEQQTKFTVVIWLEGDDPECIDNILGGQFKVDMILNIVRVYDENNENPEQVR